MHRFVIPAVALNQAPAIIMVLPPPRRGWVGMLAVVVALVGFPGVLQKCIFDEVQAQAGVVHAAPIHPDLQPWETRLGTNHPGVRVTPLHDLSGRWRRSLRPTSPQPIRIRSWITRESANLSEAEKGSLETAVEEAVRTLSSLLSGD